MRSYATERDAEYKSGMEEHLRSRLQKVSPSYLVNNFPKYASRQNLTRFLVRHELFQKILNHKGCIVECGVYAGAGLMTWAELSAILEPLGVFRHCYGFDTFEGFPHVNNKDNKGAHQADWKAGDLREESYEDLLQCIKLYDANRFLPQFPKVSLVKGDFMATSEKFLKENPHVVISLLYLDFDLYDPTKKALQMFLPRMTKGSIIAFDEVNHPLWPGETLAMFEELDLRQYALQKFPYDPNISYIVL